MDLEQRLAKADRLRAITQKVGFALWQLQELEGASASYFVLVVRASPGMGTEVGKALLDKAQGKTFGGTITQLAIAGCVPKEMEARFRSLLAERNWLVHSSRSSSRCAIHNDQDCLSLLGRLEEIADEAHALITEVGRESEAFVKRYGIMEEQIEAQAAEILRKWHGENAL